MTWSSLGRRWTSSSRPRARVSAFPWPWTPTAMWTKLRPADTLPLEETLRRRPFRSRKRYPNDLRPTRHHRAPDRLREELRPAGVGQLHLRGAPGREQDTG